MPISNNGRTPQQMQQVKRKLESCLEKKDQNLFQIKQKLMDVRNDGGHSFREQNDPDTTVEEMQKTYIIGKKLSVEIKALRLKLELINNQTFTGHCLVCTELIPIERELAVLSTMLCVNCANGHKKT